MKEFNDLPIDILPLIIGHLLKPQHLAFSCQVNKIFYYYSVPRLYERTFIFAWHREGKTKVTKLFRTLANCPHLARHVRKLEELRDFPKALTTAHQEELLEICQKGIRNCFNLRSCIWTRDGSLDSHILKCLQKCPNLLELEINGHHNGNYDPRLLPTFATLQKISLVMPSSQVINTLPSWLQLTGKTLFNLTLICKSSPLVTDTLLESLAPNITNLHQLYIAGCPRVTHQGILAVLSLNAAGMTGLGLENLSQLFDMQSFGENCRRTNLLASLRSITLTFPVQGVTPRWLASVEFLLWDSPLRIVQLYTSGGQTSLSQGLDSHFARNLIDRHGERLTRFAVLRLPISLDALELICTRCVCLEQLFIAVEKSDFHVIGPKIACAVNLKTIHVTYTLGQQASHEYTVPSRENILSVVKQCGTQVTQFGVQTRVWQVERVPAVRAGGEIDLTVQLAPYESPDIPEVFLVART